MTPRELRIVSALAVFLSAALPAAAGAIAFRSQPILAATLHDQAGALPGLTGFFFNHFTSALLILLVIGLAITAFAARTHWRRPDGQTARRDVLFGARQRRLSRPARARDGAAGLREADAALSPPRGEQSKGVRSFGLRPVRLPRQSSLGVIGARVDRAAVER